MRLSGRGVGCVRGGREIFSGLHFEAVSGSALAVTGPNGSGKTSLLRLIAGLLATSGGSIELEGGEAGAFALALLQVQQELVRVRGDAPQLIQFRVVAFRDHVAVAYQRAGLEARVVARICPRPCGRIVPYGAMGAGPTYRQPVGSPAVWLLYSIWTS